MDFWVISTFYGGAERAPKGELYATPFQAMRQRDVLNATAHGGGTWRYEVRPATWREREERMFTGGVYQPPVWCDEPFWGDCALLITQHQPHISLVDPTMIAYTEDDRKGDADRQTPMRPGKYLQRFLGAGPNGVIEHGPYKGQHPKVSKMKVAFYAAWHQAGHRPESEDLLSFTEDEHEIVDAYENGPESCMMGKGWAFENHPVRVYAGGGLKLALSRVGHIRGLAEALGL